MNIREIIEAIEDPSGLIHSERQQGLTRRNHQLANHPAFPQGEGGKNFEDVLASRQWQKILQKANHYLGIPLTRRTVPQLHQKTQEALQLINSVEARHREELEALALELVLQLPEFQSARKAYDADRLGIEASLVSDIDTTGMATSESLVEDEMQQRVQRRHFANAMIHGSAVSNDFLFELGGAALDHIHPQLRKAYGILMVMTEIGYWIFPDDMILAEIRNKAHVGGSHITYESLNEAKKPVVVAQGVCFPVLIHEIVKGLLELVSMPSLPRNAAERQQVLDKTDLVDLEAWSMLLGPKLWDAFIEAVDASDERELTMHLYRRIQLMDHAEFNAFMKEVLAKSPRGIQMLKQLAATIKQELQESSVPTEKTGNTIIDRLLEDDEDAPVVDDSDYVDWKDITGIRPTVEQPTTGRYSQPPSGDRAYSLISAVSRLGLEGLETGEGQFPQGRYHYVTVDFPEGSGQSSLTARFLSSDDANTFIDYLYRVAAQRQR